MSSLGPHAPPPRKDRTYCRSERDTNKHTAQRRAISSAQAPLGVIISSLFAPNNHGPLLPAPFTYISCILPCASVAGGVGSLAEQSPVLSLEPHRLTPGIGRSTRYQVPLVRVCTRLFAFSSLVLFSISILFAIFSSQITPVLLRSERDIANIQHSTDRAISSAQVALGIVNSLVALYHGPLLPAPFTFIS